MRLFQNLPQEGRHVEPGEYDLSGHAQMGFQPWVSFSALQNTALQRVAVVGALQQGEEHWNQVHEAQKRSVEDIEKLAILRNALVGLDPKALAEHTEIHRAW